MKKSQTIEEAIALRNRYIAGIMNGREVVRLGQRFDMSADDVRSVLRRMGFKLERTFGGRPIWRKSD